MTKQLWTVAHHEAGHAVVAFICGVKIFSISIKPDANGEGFVTHQKLVKRSIEFELSPRDMKRAQLDATIALAGDIAEQKFDPNRKFGAGPDYRRVLDVLLYVERGSKRLKPTLPCSQFEPSRSSYFTGRWSKHWLQN